MFDNVNYFPYLAVTRCIYLGIKYGPRIIYLNEIQITGSAEFKDKKITVNMSINTFFFF